jgi:hypothetical protein
MATPGFDNLTNGSLVLAVSEVLTYVMGDWWLFLLLLLTVGMTYLATRSYAAAFLVTIAGFAYYWTDLSAIVHPFVYAILVFSLAAILFYAIGKGKGD